MNYSTKKLATVAVIGALYAALTLALAPLSYGVVQFRISEVLCILPFFFPESAVGLTIGCVIANLLGSGMGPLDIIFGSLATFLAGICTAAIGIRARRSEKIGWGICIAACFMPVVFNAPIIGAVISFTSLHSGSAQYGFWQGLIAYGGWVGLGEAGVLFALGLPSMRYVLKNESLKKILSGCD